MSVKDKKNAEGYPDPTAYKAIKKITGEETRYKTLIRSILDICSIAGFRIKGRIVLVDKRTGKVWR